MENATKPVVHSPRQVGGWENCWWVGLLANTKFVDFVKIYKCCFRQHVHSSMLWWEVHTSPTPYGFASSDTHKGHSTHVHYPNRTLCVVDLILHGTVGWAKSGFCTFGVVHFTRPTGRRKGSPVSPFAGGRIGTAFHLHRQQTQSTRAHQVEPIVVAMATTGGHGIVSNPQAVDDDVNALPLNSCNANTLWVDLILCRAGVVGTLCLIQPPVFRLAREPDAKDVC